VHSDLDAQQRRALRLGVAGAVLAFLALTGVQAVAIRPYLPPDELYHVGYAAPSASTGSRARAAACGSWAWPWRSSR
jgi:hypothetical protein